MALYSGSVAMTLLIWVISGIVCMLGRCLDWLSSDGWEGPSDGWEWLSNGWMEGLALGE